MGRKIVIRWLAKYLPLSIEFQTVSQLDELVANGKDQALDTFDIDATLVQADSESQGYGDADPETGEIDLPRFTESQGEVLLLAADPEVVARPRGKAQGKDELSFFGPNDAPF